jgi:hypothetical protein
VSGCGVEGSGACCLVQHSHSLAKPVLIFELAMHVFCFLCIVTRQLSAIFNSPVYTMYYEIILLSSSLESIDCHGCAAGRYIFVARASEDKYNFRANTAISEMANDLW